MEKLFVELTIEEAKSNLSIMSEGPVGGCGIGCSNY